MKTKIEYEFINYKLLEKLKISLESGNIYFVQGKNNTGKSSALKGLMANFQAKDETQQKVTLGKQEGSIKGHILLPDGNKYFTKFDFKKDGKDRFTLIMPNGMKTNKTTDIRDIFKYNSFTAEEFLAWGKTAEGKRKQRDIVLQLLTQEEQIAFGKLCQDEKEKYSARTEVNNDANSLSKICEGNNLSKENEELLAKEEDYKIGIETCKTKIIEADVIFRKNSITNHRLRELNIFDEGIKETKAYSSEIIDECILHINKIKEILQKEIKEEIINTSSYNEKLEIGNKLIENIIGIKARQSASEGNKIKLKEAKEKWTILDNELTLIRKNKDELINNSKLPIKNILIKEDGIYLDEPGGELPFDTNQIATSKAMKIVIKILLHLNKTLPLILVGRAESFDKKSLNEMSEYAKENECIMIMEKVLEDGKDLEIICYEN